MNYIGTRHRNIPKKHIFAWCGDFCESFYKLKNGNFQERIIGGRCDIVTYTGKYIFGLHPCFWHRNPWNSHSKENPKDVFYFANEVAFGPRLRMGAGCQ